MNETRTRSVVTISERAVDLAVSTIANGRNSGGAIVFEALQRSVGMEPQSKVQTSLTKQQTKALIGSLRSALEAMS